MGEPLACKVSRYSIFILMLMFYSLLTQVVKLKERVDMATTSSHVVRLYAMYGDIINWYVRTYVRSEFELYFAKSAR
jgi:hypothetical protein